jgi:hypothetical protein
VAAGGGARGWDPEFESALLQRRVSCEPFPRGAVAGIRTEPERRGQLGRCRIGAEIFFAAATICVVALASGITASAENLAASQLHALKAV